MAYSLLSSFMTITDDGVFEVYSGGYWPVLYHKCGSPVALCFKEATNEL